LINSFNHLAENLLKHPQKETPKIKKNSKQQKKRRRLGYLLRITVEGIFGQDKGRYRLNYIRVKLASTTASWIGAIFFDEFHQIDKFLVRHILFFCY